MQYAAPLLEPMAWFLCTCCRKRYPVAVRATDQPVRCERSGRDYLLGSVPPFKDHDWKQGSHADLMLRIVRDHLTVTDRKKRLFFVALARAFKSAGSSGGKDVLDHAEQCADHLISVSELHETIGGDPEKLPCFAQWAMQSDLNVALSQAADYFDYYRQWSNPLSKAAKIIREVLGNPFHQLQVNPLCFHFNDGTVRKVAKVIYDERRFDELPILADALEDAGCLDGELLSHFRDAKAHVRGCWALDLLLAKD